MLARTSFPLWITDRCYPNGNSKTEGRLKNHFRIWCKNQMAAVQCYFKSWKVKSNPKSWISGQTKCWSKVHNKNECCYRVTQFSMGTCKNIVDMICFCACICLSFSFSIWYLSNREGKAVLINGIFKDMVCKPSKCKSS